MNCFFGYLTKILLIVFILYAAIPAYAEQAPDAYMREHKNIEGVYTYKKTSRQRASFSFSVKKFSRDGKAFCKLTEQGKGDYDKYEDVTWESEAEAEEKEGLLYIIYSRQIIRNKDKTTIIKHQKHFDYDKCKIYYTASDGEGNIIEERTFPIKGKTCDNMTMMYFLRAFAAHHDEKAYRSFYLVTNEPKFYRVNIRFIKTEVLDMPIGKIKAVKLKLIPDMGLLTGLVGAFIPPTFAWYTEDPPYNWLQYEGLETGLGSAYIAAQISTAN